MKKFYLLDTSIILDSIENIEYIYENGKNEIFICDVVLDELERKKDSSEEVGFFAREFFRSVCNNFDITEIDSIEFNIESILKISNKLNDKITTIFLELNIIKTQDSIESNNKLSSQNTEQNTKIPLHIIHRPRYKTRDLDYSQNDARIAEIAADYELILLSNDSALNLRAFCRQIKTQSLRRERVANPQNICFFSRIIAHENTKIEDLAEFKKLKQWAQIEIDEQNDTDGSLYFTGRKIYGIKVAENFVPLDFDELLKEENLYVNPLNLEQKFLYVILTHPQNRISVCAGSTGSGKTLIALISALSLLKKGQISGIVYLRNTITANDKAAELGFRKGDEAQKLDYFLYPLYSAVNFIITHLKDQSLAKRIEYRGDSDGVRMREATEYFLQKHCIESLDIAHARGISLDRKFVIFDEAQNASDATIKLIGTRIGAQSRICFLGDFNQIDHPYLSRQRNGLVSLLQKAENSDFLAGVRLNQTIRSDIAAWFDENF